MILRDGFSTRELLPLPGLFPGLSLLLFRKSLKIYVVRLELGERREPLVSHPGQIRFLLLSHLSLTLALVVLARPAM